VSLLRRKRKELHALGEADVYAHSYGDRSDDVTNVKRMPPEASADGVESTTEPRLTDRKIRDAFRARLDRRDPS
jgi:hypothetical protein